MIADNVWTAMREARQQMRFRSQTETHRAEHDVSILVAMQ